MTLTRTTFSAPSTLPRDRSSNGPSHRRLIQDLRSIDMRQFAIPFAARSCHVGLCPLKCLGRIAARSALVAVDLVFGSGGALVGLMLELRSRRLAGVAALERGRGGWHVGVRYIRHIRVEVEDSGVARRVRVWMCMKSIVERERYLEDTNFAVEEEIS